MKRLFVPMLAVAIGLGGCEKRESSSEKPERAPTETPEEPKVEFGFPSNGLPCTPDAAAMIQKWTDQYFAWRTTVSFADAHVVSRPRSAPLFDTPIMVSLTVGGARLVGEEAPDKALDQVLDASIEQSKADAKRAGHEWTHPGFALAVAPDVPWSRVVEATELAVARTGEGNIEFAFENPRPEELGQMPEQLRGQLAELRQHGVTHAANAADADDGHGHNHGQTGAQKRAAAHLADCEMATKLEEQLEKLEPDARENEFAEKVGKTWVDCACGPDIEWWIGRRMAEGSGRALSRVGVKIDADAEAVVLEPEVPWAEAADVLLEASQPLTLDFPQQ